MGIYDRHYVFERRPSAFGRTPVTFWLIILNVAIFVIGAMMHGMGVPRFLQRVPLLDERTMAQMQIDAHALVAEKNFRPLVPGTLEPRGDVFASEADLRRMNNVVSRVQVDPKTGAAVLSDLHIIEDPLTAWGHFSTHTILRGEVWRLITFQFLHAGIMHILFNMIGLWIFGRLTEERMGSSSRYLAFYLICGLCGGLMYLLLNGLGNVANYFGYSIPGLLPGSSTLPLVGASAGVFGVIMAAAYLEPKMQVMLLFPPIPLSIRALAYGYVIVAIVVVLFNLRNAGGEAAHLGGAAAGWFFIRRSHLLKDFFADFTDLWDRVRKAGRRTPSLKLVGGEDGPVKAAPKPRTVTLRDIDPALDAEVDRILRKSSEQGTGSLTADELGTLKRGTDAMNRPR